MTERSWGVSFTANASAQVDAIRAWWATERAAAPTLFIDELSSAIDRRGSSSPAVARYIPRAPFPTCAEWFFRIADTTFTTRFIRCAEK